MIVTLCPQMASSPATLEPRAPQPTTATTTIFFFFLFFFQFPQFFTICLLIYCSHITTHFLALLSWQLILFSPGFIASNTEASISPCLVKLLWRYMLQPPAWWSCCQHWHCLNTSCWSQPPVPCLAFLPMLESLRCVKSRKQNISQNLWFYNFCPLTCSEKNNVWCIKIHTK